MAAWCVGYLLLAAALWAQEAAAPRTDGFPQDWSDHNLAFTLDGLAENPELIYQEPRILHQVMQRFQAHRANALPEVEAGAEPIYPNTHDRDWSVALGKGHVSAEMYPAKYSFNPNAQPNCESDFVVFGLATAGATGGQANLVGLNNLYAGTGGFCATGPSVMFAYNATTVSGGKIVTSPVISLDGTKIAFVESLGTASIFHVLTFTAGQGGVSTAAAPAAMTSLTYSSFTNTTSSPWIDYSSDVVYVGDNEGIIYKIINVFSGTPALAGSPWPVTVASGIFLTPPVLDKSRGLLLVGGKDGDLYEINTTNGAISALIVGAHGGKNAGVVAPPIVDVTNGTTFAVSANDGTSAVVVQADTTTLTQLAKARIGVGASTGTTLNTHQPALSNAYYTNPSSGAIYACGTGAGADTSPWAYSFGFVGRLMNTSPASSHQLLTTAGVGCTSWTEFFNPNVGGANGTDYFFFGFPEDCTGSGTSGCVVEITTASATPTMVAMEGGPSGIVVDNYSTDGQASSIYLTGQGVNNAYKFTQNGLH